MCENVVKIESFKKYCVKKETPLFKEKARVVAFKIRKPRKKTISLEVKISRLTQKLSDLCSCFAEKQQEELEIQQERLEKLLLKEKRKM